MEFNVASSMPNFFCISSGLCLRTLFLLSLPSGLGISKLSFKFIFPFVPVPIAGIDSLLL